MMGRRFGVELLLVSFAGITILGFILTYCVSVELNHVTPYLPYISDTGGKPPESCIFSLICNIAILFELLIVYIRYKSVHHIYTSQVPTVCIPLKIINIFGLFIGLLSAFGFLLVANFQNDYVPSVHFVGAFVVFSAGILYQWVQTYITFRIYRSGVADHLRIGWVVAQVIICVSAILFYVGAVLFSLLAFRYRHHRPQDDSGTFYWSKDDGGFIYHVISTSCEWAMSSTLLLFFLTFHPDFKIIKVDVIVRQRTGSNHGNRRYGSVVNDENTPLTL